MSKVYRRQLVEGVTIPAIIHNGSYFLIDMAVYEDGTVSCWHKSGAEDSHRRKAFCHPSGQFSGFGCPMDLSYAEFLSTRARCGA